MDFYGYRYAITKSQDMPTSWSDIVRENQANFVINDQEEHYLHIITYDNAGNASKESVYGPYRIDKISPKVEATPISSDWTNQPIDINISLSDEGGSNLQKYKYAITNSGIMPTEWEKEIAGSGQTITINQEGEHYLHIVGYDNAGNESANSVFGKYKLDFTMPMLIGEEKVNSGSNVPYIKFSTADDISGVKKFVVNGNEVNKAEYIARQNGEYTFEITDNAGNVYVKTLEINNLYCKCDSGLEHPEYSSSYEKCPICDLIDGIKIISNEKTYGEIPMGVTYSNTKDAEVIEYYNQQTGKPSKVGEYDYELKIMYDEELYNTGLVGRFTINKKEVNIVGLKLESKIYDGKTNAKINTTNAKIQGLEDYDKEYIELEIIEEVNYDTENPGHKSVTLQKDIDYKLKLKENVGISYKELIDFYKLPDTITLTSKIVPQEINNYTNNSGNNNPNSIINNGELPKTLPKTFASTRLIKIEPPDIDNSYRGRHKIDNSIVVIDKGKIPQLVTNTNELSAIALITFRIIITIFLASVIIALTVILMLVVKMNMYLIDFLKKKIQSWESLKDR